MPMYPWQNSQWQTLLQRIHTNKLPHAMLLIGAQGLGKLDFALSFVGRLFCSSPLANEAWGHCEACHLLKIKHHPDLKLVAAEEGKQVISVDQIHSVHEIV